METSDAESLKVILTGATGMVGEGVLHACLADERVTSVLVLTRRPTGESHSKLQEVIVPDFFDLSAAREALSDYDACLFAAGVSSIGKSEAEFTRLTHTLTLGVARMLAALNPAMTFCYISGMGTDSTEKGRVMWARVKGKTENDLQQLPFARVYLFRPGFLQKGKGAKRTLKAYRYIGWLVPLIKLVMPRRICTLEELGRAMIGVCVKGYERPVLEVDDIRRVAAASC